MFDMPYLYFRGNGSLAKGRKSTLRQDFAIFGDAGFLITLALLLLLFAMATGVLIWTSEEYGIPLSPYWK